MIARDYVTAWRANAPWISDHQVEQDLVGPSTALNPMPWPEDVAEVMQREARPRVDGA